MWRSIVIYDGEKLSTRNNWLIIDFPDGEQKQIPLEDVFCIVVDNRTLSITVPLLAKLAQYQINLITTDERHLPVSQTLPLNTHYRCYKVLKDQLRMSRSFRDEAWKRIVTAKIMNQAVVLGKMFVDPAVVERIKELANEIVANDSGNREGIAAKMFFRNLYGSGFVRFSDDKINDALDYGYAIIRSGLTKTLVAYGFNCVIGIHHISETNAFNLADDFMEPFRPLVDEWIVFHPDLVEQGLLKETKAGLINLLNIDLLFEGKKTKLRYAFDLMIRSWVTAIDTDDPERLVLPQIISQVYD
jgi:CRISPR-associated protein Cas1